MGVTGPGLDIGQARRKANMCARGVGKFYLMNDPSYLWIKKKKTETEL